jgi:hypothetical protein
MPLRMSFAKACPKRRLGAGAGLAVLQQRGAALMYDGVIVGDYAADLVVQ